MTLVSNKKWDRAMALIGVLALFLCILLTAHSLSGAKLIGCSGGSSCDTVLGSKWSMLFGILPIAALGAGLYLAMIVCFLFHAAEKDPEMEALIRKVLVFLAVADIAASLWFILLQFWKIGKFCPYCMATHTTGIILSVLVLVRYARGLKGKALVLPCVFGLAGAGALITVQLLATPDYRYDEGYVPGGLPVASAEKYPVIGDNDAENIIEVLFDYRCPHCRRIHFWLEDIVRENPGKYAFVLCPTPLSMACNPYIPSGGEDYYKGSCELIKYALAFWFMDRDMFREYDAWLFEAWDGGEWHPRPAEDAWKKAISMAGEEKFRKALQDNRIQDYLDLTLEIFGRTTREGRSGIPRLVFGQDWIIPEADSKDALMEVLRKAFEI